MKKSMILFFSLILCVYFLPGWENPVNLSSSLDHCVIPRIAVGYDGAVHTVWFEYNPNSGIADIYYRKHDKSGWQQKVNITNTPWISRDPGVAVDKAGNVFITWIDTFNRPSQRFGLAFKEISATGEISDQLVLISDVGKDLHNPMIASDDDGNLSIVSYLNWDGIIGINRDYGVWSPWQVVSRPESEFATESCHVVFGPDGYFHGVWPEFQRGYNDHMTIYYTRRKPGEDWETPKDVWFIKEAQSHPKLAVNENGDLYIVWMEHTGNFVYFEIYFTKWDNSAKYWSTPRPVSQTDDYCNLPSIVLTRNGTIYTAWTYGPWGNLRDAYHNYAAPGSDFLQRPIPFFNTPINNPYFTQLASGGPNDNVFFIYEQVTKSNQMKDIFFTSLKPVSVSLPVFAPINASGQQINTIKINQHFSNFFNLLKWEENPENAKENIEVAGYRIYRKELDQEDEQASLLQTTENTVFSYVDYNIERNKTYVYLLAAIDDEGNESEKTTVSVSPRQ